MNIINIGIKINKIRNECQSFKLKTIIRTIKAIRIRTKSIGLSIEENLLDWADFYA